MIIEAGYDLHFLLAPTVHEEHLEGRRRSVWALGADQDLRLVLLSAVTPWRGHHLEQYVDSLASAFDAVDDDDAAHYALAYWSPVVLEDGPGLSMASEELSQHPALRARHLLGVAVYDDEGYRQTFPRADFNEYMSYEHLPRAHVLPGPHERHDCSCAACDQRRARSQERSRRRQYGKPW